MKTLGFGENQVSHSAEKEGNNSSGKDEELKKPPGEWGGLGGSQHYY